MNPPFQGETKVFDLAEVGDSGISGTAKFIEMEDHSVSVELELNGTTDGSIYPSHIHFNSAAEGGEIAISLQDLDGSTGVSNTKFSELGDDTSITYGELIEFDGYINVHQSADDLETLVAQGNIGSNQ